MITNVVSVSRIKSPSYLHFWPLEGTLGGGGGDIHLRIVTMKWLYKRFTPHFLFRVSSPLNLNQKASSPFPLRPTFLTQTTPSKAFTMGSTNSNPNPTDTFVELAKNRRTYYALSPKSPVPDSRIEQLVHDAVLHVPSSFNTQSTRIVLLLHEQHQKLWDITTGIFEELVEAGKIPKEMWDGHTKPKLAAFKKGYGTVSDCSLMSHRENTN